MFRILTGRTFICICLLPFVHYFEETFGLIPKRYERIVFTELPHLLLLVYVVKSYFRWRLLKFCRALNGDTGSMTLDDEKAIIAITSKGIA